MPKAGDDVGAGEVLVQNLPNGGSRGIQAVVGARLQVEEHAALLEVPIADLGVS
jgi:hypothetical protein